MVFAECITLMEFCCSYNGIQFFLNLVVELLYANVAFWISYLISYMYPVLKDF